MKDDRKREKITSSNIPIAFLPMVSKLIDGGPGSVMG
jgi:hypothetical protein